jgi:hypothetical protein
MRTLGTDGVPPPPTFTMPTQDFRGTGELPGPSWFTQASTSLSFSVYNEEVGQII